MHEHLSLLNKVGKWHIDLHRTVTCACSAALSSLCQYAVLCGTGPSSSHLSQGSKSQHRRPDTDLQFCPVGTGSKLTSFLFSCDIFSLLSINSLRAIVMTFEYDKKNSNNVNIQVSPTSLGNKHCEYVWRFLCALPHLHPSTSRLYF